METEKAGHGRVVRVTTAADGQTRLYVVAEPDEKKAVETLRGQVAKARDRIEIVGRASDHLIKALGLPRGTYRRV